MEVILCQDVPKVGKTGDVVKVKDGYARNLLLPKKMAYVATASNLKRIEKQKEKAVAVYTEGKKSAEDLAKKLSKASCTVTVEVNDLDKLYGSVTESEVCAALELEGFNIDKKQVVLENPITELGIFEVNINLHPEVTAKIRLWVAKK